jgi:hypothetical protein
MVARWDGALSAVTITETTDGKWAAIWVGYPLVAREVTRRNHPALRADSIPVRTEIPKLDPDFKAMKTIHVFHLIPIVGLLVGLGTGVATKPLSSPMGYGADPILPDPPHSLVPTEKIAPAVG